MLDFKYENYKKGPVSLLEAAIPKDYHEFLGDLSKLIAQESTRYTLDHTEHPTCRDSSRPKSMINKIGGLLMTGGQEKENTAAQALAQIVKAIILPGLGLIGVSCPEYDDLLLEHPYSAVGHHYGPSDPREPTECHVDEFSSGTLYIETPSEGGELVISQDPNTQSIGGVTESDPLIHAPKRMTVVVFNGQRLPHYVEPVTKGIRTSVNFSLFSARQEGEANGIAYFGLSKN